MPTRVGPKIRVTVTELNRTRLLMFELMALERELEALGLEVQAEKLEHALFRYTQLADVGLMHAAKDNIDVYRP